MKVYTIGFTQKTAEEFFELLKTNSIKSLIDIRYSNNTHLSGFSKITHLPYFLKEICGISYFYIRELAPTEKMSTDYKKGIISWKQYEDLFSELMKRRNAIVKLNSSLPEGPICLLCGELKATNCHRRLVAEMLKEIRNDVEITDL